MKIVWWSSWSGCRRGAAAPTRGSGIVALARRPWSRSDRALRAVGIEDLAVGKIVLVWVAGTGAASLSPTPGGIGAVEVAMAATLAAFGVRWPDAVLAVLVYRLTTFKIAGSLGPWRTNTSIATDDLKSRVQRPPEGESNRHVGSVVTASCSSPQLSRPDAASPSPTIRTRIGTNRALRGQGSPTDRRAGGVAAGSSEDGLSQ
jgi:Lysylphosphatidylglycerol synthase TM region